MSTIFNQKETRGAKPIAPTAIGQKHRIIPAGIGEVPCAAVFCPFRVMWAF
jgi:hypothetical protein